MRAKRVKTWVLTLVALLATQTAWAETIGGSVKDHFSWIFNTVTGELQLIGVEGQDGVVEYAGSEYDAEYKEYVWHTGDDTYILKNPNVERSRVKSVRISTQITSIRSRFFSYGYSYACKNLETVTVESDNDLTIGASAFFNSPKLKTFYTGGKVTSIGAEAFSGCAALENFQNDSGAAYVSGLTSIGQYAFSDTGLKSFTLIGSAIDIPQGAFWGCKALETFMALSVGAIGDVAFCGCTKLNSFSTVFGPTSLGEQAFRNCESLREFVSAQLESVPTGAPFAGCSSLDYVAMPAPDGTFSRSDLGLRNYTGTLLYVSKNSTVTDGDKNTIVGNQCKQLEIDGSKPFNAYRGASFTADFVSFSRNFEAGRYYAICLPYVYKNAGWTFYTLKKTQSKIGDNTLSFEEVDQANLEAGQPYVVYTGKTSAKDLNVNSKTAVTTAEIRTSWDAYSLQGNFKKTMDADYLTKNYSNSYLYVLQNDGTWAYMDPTLDGSEIAPYTAFLYVDNTKGSGTNTILSAYGSDALTPCGLAFSQANVTIAYGDDVAALTPTLSNPHALSVTYDSSNPLVATVDAATGALTLLKAGSTTISAITPGNATYANGSASYTLMVQNGGETPEFAFSHATVLCGLGETPQAPQLQSTEGLTASYASSNPAVATVNAATGALTPVGTGLTTITATAEGNMQYNGATASYNLIVLSAEEAARVRCDANGDGKVTITDAVTVVNKILDGAGE